MDEHEDILDDKAHKVLAQVGQAIKEAVEVEREACAAVAEECIGPTIFTVPDQHGAYINHGKEIAAAIRARTGS